MCDTICGQHISCISIICLVTLTFDLFNLITVPPITCHMNNLITDFGLSRTFHSESKSGTETGQTDSVMHKSAT